MEVSNCPECKKALKAALLKGTDPSKLKMKDGHLPGCPSLSPEQKEDDNAVRRPATDPTTPVQQAWPWSEEHYRIAPSQRGPAGSNTDRSGTGDRPTAHGAPGGPDRSAVHRPPDRAAGVPQRRPDGASRGRAGVPSSGYAQAEAAAKNQHVQQFKVVDHANRGEQKDHRKGAWFVALVILALLTVPLFPPLALLYLGAIAMLFCLR